MNDAKIAWAAGLIEGEGCFWSWSLREGNHVYRYPKMQVNSTDEDVLQRLRSILGGELSGPYAKDTPDHPRRKMQWQWSVNRMAEFDRIAELIRPWLCERRMSKLDEVRAVARGRVRS